MRARRGLANGVTVGSPSAITIALGVLLAVGQLLAQLFLDSGSQLQWRDIIAVALQAFATLGISPLFGPKLTALWHIPPKVLLAVGLFLTAANGVLTIVSLSHVLHIVIATVLTLVGGLLFGATAGSPVAAAAGVSVRR